MVVAVVLAADIISVMKSGQRVFCKITMTGDFSTEAFVVSEYFELLLLSTLNTKDVESKQLTIYYQFSAPHIRHLNSPRAVDYSIAIPFHFWIYHTFVISTNLWKLAIRIKSAN